MRFRLWIPSVHHTECLTQQFLNNSLPNTKEHQAIVTAEPFTANRREELAAVGRLPLFMGALLFLVLTSCGVTRTQRIGLPESSRAAGSVVARIREQVEGEIQQHVGVDQAAVVSTLTGPGTFPANFKQTVVFQTLGDPWKGMAALERQGSRLAELAKREPSHGFFRGSGTVPLGA